MHAQHEHSTFTLNIYAQHSRSTFVLSVRTQHAYRQRFQYRSTNATTYRVCNSTTDDLTNNGATTTRFKHRAECVCRGASRQCSADRGIACSATCAASSPASVSRSAVLYGVLGRVRTNAIKLFLCDAACVDENLTIAFSLLKKLPNGRILPHEIAERNCRIS